MSKQLFGVKIPALLTVPILQVMINTLDKEWYTCHTIMYQVPRAGFNIGTTEVINEWTVFLESLGISTCGAGFDIDEQNNEPDYVWVPGVAKLFSNITEDGMLGSIARRKRLLNEIISVLES